MYLFLRALAFSLCLWLPASWAADSGWLQDPNNSHARVQISTSQPEEGTVRLLLDVRLSDGWKTYWRSPGEGGIAPEIKWQTPVEHVNWRWPTPQRFDVSGISTQGYHGDTVFPITLNVPKRPRDYRAYLPFQPVATFVCSPIFPSI